MISILCLWRRFSPAAIALICIVGTAQAAEKHAPPVNAQGMPVLDAEGRGINYSREELESKASTDNRALKTANSTAASASAGFVPASTTPPPFWQYAIFGSGIGLSNIIIGPAPADGGPREIIVGNANSFWQVLRRNSVTNNYDQIFVSPVYSSTIKRMALGNVTGNATAEIVVMLEDGRIYLYDSTTKRELGYITTGVTGLEGLNLADLTGDHVSELIVTTAEDLLVFTGAGTLAWKVPGAGGTDVVTGQMDTDPALEIATTKGVVIDAATHLAQWTRSGGFGNHLKLAPLPGASYKQLIAAEAWQFVYAYDVASKLPRWSITTPQDIGAIEIADVNKDGTPEVIIGDGQWGTIHVHDLVTQAKKWETGNPEHGVTNIAVGDVDNDGMVDLLWGAGYTSSGSDYLYVANTSGTHDIKWQSVDLQGPFLGPSIGDLDGDGRLELVVCSYASESGYSSGRILVFDVPTLTLRAISLPIVSGQALTGVHDLKVLDLDGDGRMEIVVAADKLYDGAIEIYNFDSSNAFNVKWTNTTRPSGSPFNFVEVADLDGNGTPEIIAGNTVAHTGSEGVYVYIFDYPSTTDPWRSVNLAGGFSSVTGLVVQDLDKNGSKDIAALIANGDQYTFEGPTRTLKSLVQQTGGTILSRRIPSGLVRADSTGVAHFLEYKNNTYTESFSLQLGTTTLDGLNVLPNALWTGTGGVLNLRVPPSFNVVQWQSAPVGPGFGRFVATDYDKGQTRVFSSAQHAVVGFTYQPSSPTPTPTTSPTPTPSPTSSPTPTPTPSASATPTPTPTPTPSASATPTPTPTPAFGFVPGHYYSSNYSSRVITEYTGTGAVVGSYTVSSALGEEVRGLAFGADGLLYATLSRGSSGFAVLALKSNGTVMATYTGSTYIAGNLSFGKIALDNQYLYVCGQDSLTRFVLGSPSSGTTIYSNNQIFDVKTLPNGHLFVASAYNIDEITTSGTILRSIQLTGGQSFTDIRGIEYNPKTNILFVTHLGSSNFSFKVMRVDATSGALLGSASFTYGDDLFLDFSGRLLVGSRTEKPTFFSQDLVQGSTLNGGQQMFVTQYAPVTPTPTPTPGLVGNVSTRLPVGTGDDALIEGFIVQGPAGSTKKMIMRAIGPSLVPFGIPDALADPTLEIHNASNATIATNNDWKTTQVGGIITGNQFSEINASGVAPSNDLESAIIANLAPGDYTAVMRGLGNTVGTGVVDAFDLSPGSAARVVNFSTRGLIQPGDKLMIAGFIVQNGPVKAVVRAIGPSLTAFGIPNALPDTTLQLRDQNGAIVRENDDWQSDPAQKEQLESVGLQPSDNLEAALVETIQPGSYTAQVRGKGQTSGIGVVQVYFLP